MANIASDIEKLIKDRLKQLKLVDSGDLLNSIKVISHNGGFKVEALDYFQYLDDKYNILDYVFDSQAFIDLIIEESGKQIGDEIFKNFE